MKGVEAIDETTIRQLEQAVSSGDEENARLLVAKLASKKQSIKIELIPKLTGDNGYSIKINMEDRLSSAPPFHLKIHSQTTAGDLKKMVCLKYRFPVQVQRLIVSQKIPKDKDVLSKHGVKEGSTVYIYMVPAHKVDLTREQFQEELAQMHGRFRPDGGPQSNPHLSMPTLDLSILRVSGPKSEIFFPGAGIGASPSLPPTIPMEQEKIGWRCPSCTYINLPHRPGCEMCTSSRPSDYEIPENYEMSPKEIDWLKMENDALIAHKEVENNLELG